VIDGLINDDDLLDSWSCFSDSAHRRSSVDLC